MRWPSAASSPSSRLCATPSKTARASRAWPSWLAMVSSCWAKLSPASARRTPVPEAPNCDLAHFFLPPEPASCAAPLVRHTVEAPNCDLAHFFLPPEPASSLPSQFLKVSHTSGCWGWKLHWAISLDFKEWGSSIFLPPVSFPIFHLSLEMRHADRPHRTKPMGE